MLQRAMLDYFISLCSASKSLRYFACYYIPTYPAISNVDYGSCGWSQSALITRSPSISMTGSLQSNKWDFKRRKETFLLRWFSHYIRKSPSLGSKLHCSVQCYCGSSWRYGCVLSRTYSMLLHSQLFFPSAFRGGRSSLPVTMAISPPVHGVRCTL